MPKIANTFFVAACSLFFRPGIWEYQLVDPDLFFVRARAHQNILWIISLFLGLLQRGEARLLAVIPLFEFRETGEFRGARPFHAVFRCK